MTRILLFLLLAVVSASAQLARSYTKVFTQPTNIIDVPANKIIRVTALGGHGAYNVDNYTVEPQPVGTPNVFAGPCQLHFEPAVVNYELVSGKAKTLWFTGDTQTIRVPAGRSLHVLDGMKMEEVSIVVSEEISFLLQEYFMNPKTEWVGPLTINIRGLIAQNGTEGGYLTYEIRPVAPRRVQ